MLCAPPTTIRPSRKRKKSPTSWAKGLESLKKKEIFFMLWPRRDSNPRLSEPESDVLFSWTTGPRVYKNSPNNFLLLELLCAKDIFFTFSFSSTTNHLLFRVVKIGVCDFFQYFVEILCRLPLGHGEVVQQVIAAVFRGSTRHLALEVGHKPESLFH